MGGKSRKGSGPSKALIDKLVGGNNPSSRKKPCGSGSCNKQPDNKGFGINESDTTEKDT